MTLQEALLTGKPFRIAGNHHWIAPEAGCFYLHTAEILSDEWETADVPASVAHGEWICESCGWHVLDDGCGYVYSGGAVVECAHCEVRKLVPPSHTAILSVHEELKEGTPRA